jgi:serine/threonine protein kinase
MDWFMAWPRDALIAVAQHFLGDFEIACSADVKKNVIETMGVVQDGVTTTCADYFTRYRRQTYVTPTSYLSFLNSYRKLYDDKKTFVAEVAVMSRLRHPNIVNFYGATLTKSSGNLVLELLRWVSARLATTCRTHGSEAKRSAQES